MILKTIRNQALEDRLSLLCEDELAGRLASERASHTAAIANEEVSLSPYHPSPLLSPPSQLLELRQKNDQLRVQLSDANHRLETAIEGKSLLAEAVARGEKMRGDDYHP